MTQEDYEQKKRECWKEFQNTIFNNPIPISPYTAFSNAFDRAYALGKEKETISQEEIEKAAQERADNILYDYRMEDMLRDDLRVDMINLFKDAVDFALGKHENDADTVIKGWVARASDGHLALFKRKPDREIYRRSNNNGLWFGGSMTELDSELFPDLTWDDDPIEVELIIKRKKK